MILSKFKNIHFQSFLGTGSMSIINFVFAAVLFRSLSTAEIGVWFFFQSSLSFMDTFRQGFLATAFVKFYSGSSKERAEEVIGSTWFIACAITGVYVLTSLPGLFFLPNVSDYSLSFFLRYYAIYLILSLPMVLAMCIAQGQLRFDRLLYIRLIQVLILLISLLIFNFFEITTLDHLMYANLLSAFIPSLIVIIKGWSGFKFILRKSKSCILELYNFGKYTVATSVSTSLFGITNTYIINFLLGPSALAIYNLGYRLMEVVEIPLRSFVATALPSLSIASNRKSKKEVIFIMKRYIGMITIALIPFLVFIFLFADFAMGIIGGGSYRGTVEGITAANITRIAVVYALLSPMDRFLALTLDVIHKPEINSVKILIMLIVNIIAIVTGVYILKNIYGVALAAIFPTITAIIIAYNAINKHYLAFNLLNTFSSGYQLLKDLIKRNMSQLSFNRSHSQ